MAVDDLVSISGLVAILLSVLLGSLLTYIIQSRTQKNTWRRDSRLRKIDETYGPLFNEIHNIASFLSTGGPILRINLWMPIQESKWRKVKESYRLYLIESSLRDELVAFYNLFFNFQEKHSSIITTVEEKLIMNIRDVFYKDTQSASARINFTDSVGRHSGLDANLSEAVANCQHPFDYHRKRFPGKKFFDLTVHVSRKDRGETILEGMKKNKRTTDRFGRVISTTISEWKEDPLYSYILENIPKLLQQSKHLEEELKSIIEEPWKD